MKISRKYYDHSKREIQEMEMELEMEKKKKTAEKLQLEMQKTEASAKRLFKKIEKMESQTRFVRNEKKCADFEMFYKGALIVAEYLSLNVEINTDNSHYATIEFTTDSFYLVKEAMGEIHVLVGMLFAFADEAWIDQKDGLVRIIFFFQLNDMVER